VTIRAKKRQSPVLGTNVFVGAGAKIIGSVQIGDGAKIGANAVVLTNIPPNATAVGIPAKVVRIVEPNRIEAQPNTAEENEKKEGKSTNAI
jgi:serine O-acetyltransferase